MPISEDELKEIIKTPNADIEKLTTISSDGKNLLTRIPKEVVDNLSLKKGNKIKWSVDSKNRQIKLEVSDVSDKKEKIG